MTDPYEITATLRKIIREELKYYTPRMGQVVDINDPLNQGRVKVTIPVLGWSTPNEGIWASPGEPRSIITPVLDDWVIIQFIDGKPDKCVYYGQAYYMSEMLPANYTGPDSQVIFEGRDNSTHITYDEYGKKMEIGNSGFAAAAREGDSTLVDAVTDSTMITWITIVSAAINTLAPGSILPGQIPTTITGKINSGSDQVDIGDK